MINDALVRISRLFRFPDDVDEPHQIKRWSRTDEPRTFEKPPKTLDWTPNEADPYWRAYVESLRK